MSASSRLRGRPLDEAVTGETRGMAGRGFEFGGDSMEESSWRRLMTRVWKALALRIAKRWEAARSFTVQLGPSWRLRAALPATVLEPGGRLAMPEYGDLSLGQIVRTGGEPESDV